MKRLLIDSGCVLGVLLAAAALLYVTLTVTKAEKAKVSYPGYPGLNNYQKSSMEDSEVDYRPGQDEANARPDALPQPVIVAPGTASMPYPVHAIDPTHTTQK
jgi:hypothetical protein